MNFTKGLILALTAVGMAGCSAPVVDTYTAEIVSDEPRTEYSSETAESGEPEILFSDCFDYDGDGYGEEIFLRYANSRNGTVPVWGCDDVEYAGYIGVWYADESGERLCAEIGTDMVERYGSDAISVFNSGGRHFISVSVSVAMGMGAPTVCLTVADNTPMRVGNTTELNINDRSRHTIFTVLDGVPYVRDCGPTAGTNNLYPLYRDGTEFRIYETTLSDMDFVRNADINNIVPELENVVNVLVRSNGLLHINYADHTDITTESGIRSLTYVLEDNIITEKYDMGEGFDALPGGIYREVMPVRDSGLNVYSPLQQNAQILSA